MCTAELSVKSCHVTGAGLELVVTPPPPECRVTGWCHCGRPVYRAAAASAGSELVSHQASNTRPRTQHSFGSGLRSVRRLLDTPGSVSCFLPGSVSVLLPSRLSALLPHCLLPSVHCPPLTVPAHMDLALFILPHKSLLHVKALQCCQGLSKALPFWPAHQGPARRTSTRTGKDCARSSAGTGWCAPRALKPH